MPRKELSRDDGELRAKVRAALEARDNAMATVGFAIKKALDAGQALRNKKAELDHGEFMRYVEQAKLGVSYETCVRWMKLAERAALLGDQVENAQSVRQAYILVGLMPEAESSAGGGSNSGGNSFLTFLTRSTTHLQAQLAQRPLDQWPLEDKRVLRDKLAPLAKLYETLLA